MLIPAIQLPASQLFCRRKIAQDGIGESQLKRGFYQRAITWRSGVWGLSLGGVALSTAVRQ